MVQYAANTQTILSMLTQIGVQASGVSVALSWIGRKWSDEIAARQFAWNLVRCLHRRHSGFHALVKDRRDPKQTCASACSKDSNRPCVATF